MTSKRQRKIAKKKAREAVTQIAADLPSTDERYHPKAGPGQVFTRELVGMESGHAKRFRNIGQSALTLAYHRGQLCSAPGSPTPVRAEDRLAAGEWFERLYTTVHSSQIRDSTDQRIGGSDRLFWTERKQTASNDLAALRARMQTTNFEIVRLFCGEGYSMIEALRRAFIESSNGGTATRIREALDDLVYTTGRARRPRASERNSTTIASDDIPTHPFQEHT